MSRKCDLTGKCVQTGNNVSHAKNRTKRRFLPNLNNVSLSSDKLKISSSALRTVDKLGGLDEFLRKAENKTLSSGALKIKKEIFKTEFNQDITN